MPGTNTSAASIRKPTMIRTTIASNGPMARQRREASSQRAAALLIILVSRSNGALAGEKFLNRSDGPKRRVLHAIGYASDRSADPADEAAHEFLAG